MTEEASHAVLLYNQQIGSLLQRGDVTRFVFDADYWYRQHRSVLGLWFDDSSHRSPQAALRLPPWFSNLLPEGQLRDWIAKDRGVNSRRELQLLLHIGNDLPGAVQVVANAGDPQHLSLITRNAAPELDEKHGAGPWKFSLAGVGMKFSLLRAGDRLTLPGRNEAGDWIVKLPDARYPLVPQNEYAVMSLAREIGIDVPDIELLPREKLPDIPTPAWPNKEDHAYAIRRFDRTNSGGRVHIEDLAQVRGWYPEAKYDGSFASVAALIYRNIDEASLREFIRRLTFSFLVGNGDAHLKNWSLIYRNGRTASLSPAYDIVCTGFYYGATDPDTTGLDFYGSKAFDRVTRAGFARIQERLRTSKHNVLDVVDETLEAFYMTWKSGDRSAFPKPIAAWIDSHSSRMLRQLARRT